MNKKRVIYTFQCPICFIVSGNMSTNISDAPLCCGGIIMDAIQIDSIYKKEGE